MAGNGFNSSTCSWKLVDARFFYRGYEAAMGPMDTTRVSRSPCYDDHDGTHTSSPVPACWGSRPARCAARHPRRALRVQGVMLSDCFSPDILVGMDTAIGERCGVLLLSLGGGLAHYSCDIVAIDAFASMEQNVLVSYCSAVLISMFQRAKPVN
mgnify:CR=1 FL=1